MTLIEINWTPSRKQLSVFGLAWLVFFGIVGAVAWRRWETPVLAGVFWAAAVLVPAVGWFVPAFLRVVYLALTFATLPIGLVVSHVILGVVYYLVLTPIGLIMRLCGRGPMPRTFDADAETYWISRGEANRPKRYFRQF